MTPDEDSSDSLSDVFHDAKIVEIVSDRLSRTVTIVATHTGLAGHCGLPGSAKLRLSMTGVASVSATTFEHWPGECESHVGKSRDEWDEVVRAYRAKGRKVTVGWDDMERTAAAADDLWILEAEVARDGGMLTISMSCHTNQAWFGIDVVAGDFSVEGTDGFPQGLDAVLALAERYWDPRGGDA